MAFSDLASNQSVSFTDAQSGGFTLKSGQSHVTSNKIISKDEALEKYNLNAAAMSPYTGIQSPPKSSWASGVVGNPISLYLGDHGDDAECFKHTLLKVVYSTSTSLSQGIVLYEDASMTALYLTPKRHYGAGGLFYINGAGVVGFISSCAGIYQYPVGTGSVICSNGRVGFNSSGRSDVYTTITPATSIVSGSILYSNEAMTIRFPVGVVQMSASGNRIFSIGANGVVSDVQNVGDPC